MSERMLSRAHILMMDNDRLHSKAAMSILQYFGHHVVLSASRAEAFALLQADPEGFDLVFVDYDMIAATPDAFISQLQAISSRLVVIVFIDSDTRIKPESLGGLRIGTVLPKPIWGRELGEAIRQVLLG